VKVGVDGADTDFCLAKGICSFGTPLLNKNKGLENHLIKFVTNIQKVTGDVKHQ